MSSDQGPPGIWETRLKARARPFQRTGPRSEQSARTFCKDCTTVELLKQRPATQAIRCCDVELEKDARPHEEENSDYTHPYTEYRDFGSNPEPIILPEKPATGSQ